jgi:hypothetical protein
VFQKLILSLLVLAAVPAAGGVVFELETQDHGYSPPRLASTSVAVAGSSLAMDVDQGPDSAGGHVIYRGDRQELIVIDPAEQSYFVMDAQTVNALAAQIERMKSQVGAALENVPASQRAYVERMMNQQQLPPSQLPSARVEIRHVGDGIAVNGYPCTRYEVHRDGRKVSDIWVTNWSNVEGGRELTPAFQGMAQFFRQLVDSLAQQAGDGQQGMGDDNMFTTVNELEGFPVACYNYHPDGTIKDAVILRNSYRGELRPADFEPPAGYRRQYLFGPQ